MGLFGILALLLSLLSAAAGAGDELFTISIDVGGAEPEELVELGGFQVLLAREGVRLRAVLVSELVHLHRRPKSEQPEQRSRSRRREQLRQAGGTASERERGAQGGA